MPAEINGAKWSIQFRPQALSEADALALSQFLRAMRARYRATEKKQAPELRFECPTCSALRSEGE
jgi:hypothetical protein